MPPKRNSLPPPPPVMTWPNATPPLVAAALTDLLKLFFNGFWFFGPALALIYCSNELKAKIGTLWGLTDAVCGAAVVIASAYATGIIAPIGVVLATSVSLIGFLAILVWILIKNGRMFKSFRSGHLQLAGSLAISLVPIVGAIPAFFFTVFRLYRKQIRAETAAYEKWEKESQAALREKQQNQTAQAMNIQANALQSQLLAAKAADAAQAAAAPEIPEGAQTAAQSA